MASDFSTQEILPGILAVSGGICNRGLIFAEGSTLVIDSGISVAEASPLRWAVDERRDRGSLILFNTHPHLDHVFGNQVFSDGTIIAHSGVRETMLTTGEQMLARVQSNPQMAERIGHVTITPPTVTFNEQLTLFIGDIEVQLLYLAVAHSPSDSVAWLPQARVLFTGDLLFNDLVPALPPGGNISNWISSLEKLEQLGAEHVIPGHGPIQKPEALSELRHWFISLKRYVAEAIAQGQDLEAATASIPARLQASAPRIQEERFPQAIQLAYHEIQREQKQ